MVLFALALVAMLFVVALVLDFSNVRNSRQSNKLNADVAAAAGLYSLAPDGVARPWRGVCAALDYVQVNNPGLSFTVTYKNGSGTELAGNPCASLQALECVAGTPTTWAWITAVGGTQAFDIKSGYVTPDPAFPEDADAYSGDNGAVANGGCDQLAVIVSKADGALFGGVAGRTGYATLSRSVGRVRIGTTGDGVPAFLMLERTACDTLSEQVGSGEAGIIVDPASATQPGIIHVDSSGLPSAGCNGNNNPGGWAVYSSGSSGAKIVANPASNGTPGIIAIKALEVGLPPIAYGGATAAGLSPAPTPGRVISRKPIDEKYNSAGEPTISNVHAAAFVDAGLAAAPGPGYPASRPGAWTSLGCTDPLGLGATAAKIFVNCPAGFAADTLTNFALATDVIFNGPVSVSNGKALFMPSALRVVVGGNSSGGGLSVAGGGRLGINSLVGFADTDAGVSSACVGREGPAWNRTTELTIFGGKGSGNDQGALSVSGRAALCQTFVYLAGPRASSSYAAQQITDGTYDPSCQPSKPCAKAGGNVATNAYPYISGTVQWSAPNQMSVQPAPGSVGFEDLALWTETADLAQVKSGGILRARGVYFLPNARTEMRSPASATPQDAQFIARSLQLLQGTLRMQPTASNSVQIPALLGAGLVR